MGQVFAARVEPDVRPTLTGRRVAHRAAQRRILRFERGQDLRGRRAVDLQLPAHPGKRPQVGWKYDARHGNVWTSTDSTAGRSRAIASHLSPPSGEQ